MRRRCWHAAPAQPAFGGYLNYVPRELCALSQLELLGLPDNGWLMERGAFRLGSAPLSLLTSCRHLDLSSSAFAMREQLCPEARGALAAMPALEQVALPEFKGSSVEAAAIVHTHELTHIARLDKDSVPVIELVERIKHSQDWATVQIDIRFDEANAVLGKQLECTALPCLADLHL